MATINSSTSSSNTLSNLSAKTGIGGLVSGMDIDQLVENMTATSRQKILKQQQNVQKLEWKQTAYRSVSTAFKEFQSGYLDVISKTNLRSTSFFNPVEVSSSSTAVSVSATSSASPGIITIDSITQLAKNQTLTGKAGVSADLTGKDITAAQADLLAGLKDTSISVNLDGKVKAITFNQTFLDDMTNNGMEVAFQNAIDKTFGKNNGNSLIDVDYTSSKLTLSSDGSRITVYSVGDENDVALAMLGFASGQSNKVSTGASLSTLTLATPLDAQDTYEMTINGTEFKFAKEDTLSSVISRINSSSAGVTVSYSTITDQFSMVAKDGGAGDNIVINETNGKLMTSLGLTQASGATTTPGQNAILKVNGQDIVRTSNSFEIDGVQIELKEASAAPITITKKDNGDSLIDPIKKFVEDYNAMIDLVNTLTKEKVYTDYQPLSEEQKADMSETQIKTWEDKAKSGQLRGDSILTSLSSKLHNVMTSLSVNGVSLYTMGITSAGYTENGKLQVDDEKLKAALDSKGSEIRELFTSDKG
ncbi:MAG TPA: flagellar filament capping protein FliD, partial [Anaerovoracaceae bacterium]|nr:flagellar filament capping protein FliD [Anaerovoracaceae bacterium]